MSQDSQEIRCILAPITKGTILLPNSVVAEVVTYLKPDSMERSAEWLLGQFEWSNWQIPVISYSTLINLSTEEETSGSSRILIINSLLETARVPYIGVLIHGLPRLITVTADALSEPDDQRRSLGIFSQVNVNGQAAIIPDLDRLTQLVAHAAYGALPTA